MDIKNYPVDGLYDELIDGARRPRPAAAALFEYLSEISPAELNARRAEVDAAIMTMGITFTIYSDGANIDRAWPFDIIPRVMAQRGVAPHRSRAEAAADRAESVHQRSLQRADHRQGRRVSARRSWRVPGIFARNASGRRPVLGCGRIFAAPIWCATRDGTIYVLEDNLRVPSGVSYMLENRMLMKRLFPELFEALRHPAGRRLHDAPARHPGGAVAAPGRAAGDRGAHARHLQLGLFRAQLSRPADGRGAGRRAGPGRRRGRLRLHEDHRRPAPGRRDLPPRRRRFSRSGGLPSRFRARRARPDARLAARQGRHRQCAGRGCGRRQGRLHLRAEDHPLLPRRGSDHPQCAELSVHERHASATTCWRISTSWWSSRPTNPAATAC